MSFFSCENMYRAQQLNMQRFSAQRVQWGLNLWIRVHEECKVWIVSRLAVMSGDIGLIKKAGNGGSFGGIFSTEKEAARNLEKKVETVVASNTPGIFAGPGGTLTHCSSSRFRNFIAIIGISFIAFTSSAIGKQGEFFLVVPKTSTLKSVTSSEVKQLYRRKTNEVQGKYYSPIHYKHTNQTRKLFSESVLEWGNVFREEEFLRLIKFRNERTVPVQVDSVEEMLEQVSLNTNTNGYVTADKVKLLPPETKAIPIL